MNARCVPKLLVVAFDALDPDLLRHYAAEGAMPTWTDLLSRGASAVTTSPEGLYVGAIWPSFSTGLSPSRHGRICFKQLSPGSYRLRDVRYGDVSGEPFWRWLNEAGLSTAILDLPKTALDQRIRGCHVVDWGTHDGEPRGLRTAPRGRRAEILARFPQSPIGTSCDQPRPSAQEVRAFRDDLMERARTRAEMAESLIDEGHDVVLCVFTESHCIGHQMWHHHDPLHGRHDPAIAREVGDPLRDVYLALDQALGRLVARAGPETVVVALASHGMGPHHDGARALDAALAAMEPLLPQGRPPSLSARVARLVDNRHARRWSRSMEKRLGVGLALPSRNAARTCFMVPNNEAWAGVRVNLIGREPSGRIAPGADLDRLLDVLGERLMELRNGETGGPVFTRIVRSDATSPGLARRSFPDLMAEWVRNTPIPSLAHPSFGVVSAPYKGQRTGDHRPEGLVAVVGRGIAPGPRPDRVRTEDLAPTLCALLHVEMPGVDGRPVAALLPDPAPAYSG